MASNKLKIIDPKKENIKQIHRDNWEVMKPFVVFSFKAMKVIGVALIAIVKALPLLKPEKKSNRSIVKR